MKIITLVPLSPNLIITTIWVKSYSVFTCIFLLVNHLSEALLLLLWSYLFLGWHLCTPKTTAVTLTDPGPQSCGISVRWQGVGFSWFSICWLFWTPCCLVASCSLICCVFYCLLTLIWFVWCEHVLVGSNSFWLPCSEHVSNSFKIYACGGLLEIPLFSWQYERHNYGGLCLLMLILISKCFSSIHKNRCINKNFISELLPGLLFIGVAGGFRIFN